MFRRTIAALGLIALAFAFTPALHASEFSDAYKRAQELKDSMKSADEQKRADIQQQLASYVKTKSDELAPRATSKVDFEYVGLFQDLGGLQDEAVASYRKAIAIPLDPKSETDPKTQARLHQRLVNALAEKGDVGPAWTAFEAFAAECADAKTLKSAALAVGMAAREAGRYDVAIPAMERSIALGNTDKPTTKIYINTLLLNGDKAKAVAVARAAVEANPTDDNWKYVLTAAERVGEAAPSLDFESYVPTGKPMTEGKVVVLGMWNVSAKTLRWTMSALSQLNDRYRGHPVVVMGLTTYYKKNDETGLLDLTPEAERAQAQLVRENYNFDGVLAFAADETRLREFGYSALPYFAVVGKDGKLLFASTLNPAGGGDLKILNGVIQDAVAK